MASSDQEASLAVNETNINQHADPPMRLLPNRVPDAEPRKRLLAL
jgi:hypothetical protein